MICFLLMLNAAQVTAAPRIWTDNLGQQSEAEFVEYKSPKVTLKDGAGVKASFAVSGLSETDLLYVRQLAEYQRLKDEGEPAVVPTDPHKLKLPAQLIEGAEIPALLPYAPRTWTDNNGQQLKAKLHTIIGSKILLKPEGKAPLPVEFATLSIPDQDYVHVQLIALNQFGLLRTCVLTLNQKSLEPFRNPAIPALLEERITIVKEQEAKQRAEKLAELEAKKQAEREAEAIAAAQQAQTKQAARLAEMQREAELNAARLERERLAALEAPAKIPVTSPAPPTPTKSSTPQRVVTTTIDSDNSSARGSLIRFGEKPNIGLAIFNLILMPLSPLLVLLLYNYVCMSIKLGEENIALGVFNVSPILAYVGGVIYQLWTNDMPQLLSITILATGLIPLILGLVFLANETIKKYFLRSAMASVGLFMILVLATLIAKFSGMI